MIDRQRLEGAIRAAYTAKGLEMLLQHKFNRRLDDIAARGPLLTVVFDLVGLTIREGWLEEFLRALKADRPHNKTFCELIDKTLETMKQQNGTLAPVTGLRPCNWCWWRDASDIRALANGFSQNKDRFSKRNGICRITSEIPHDLAKYVDVRCGIEVVHAANEILEISFGDNAKGKYIGAAFGGADLVSDWSGVLVDAERHGTQTLVSLFLALYLLSGSIIGAADVNLQRLHSTFKRGIK